MKTAILTFEILLGIVPFLPLLADAVFKTNIRTSIMNMTMQWPLWLKIPILILCILAYIFFWYILFKKSRESL